MHHGFPQHGTIVEKASSSEVPTITRCVPHVLATVSRCAVGPASTDPLELWQALRHGVSFDQSLFVLLNKLLIRCTHAACPALSIALNFWRNRGAQPGTPQPGKWAAFPDFSTSPHLQFITLMSMRMSPWALNILQQRDYESLLVCMQLSKLTQLPKPYCRAIHTLMN